MAEFSYKRFIIVITVAVLTIVLSKKVVEGKRQHFYARQSKDLRRLADLDFELMLKLKSLEPNLTHEQKSSSSLLSSAVEIYFENFSEESAKPDRSVNPVDATRTGQVEEILRNPLAMLKAIHRLGLFLHSLNSSPPDLDLVSELDMPVLTRLRNEFGIYSFPLSQDLADAADGMLHMQFTYKLKASDLSQGTVFGMPTTAKLQAFHCYYIGLRAKSQKKFTLAVEWLLEAKLQATIERKLADIPAINAELVETIKYHDKFLWTLQFKDPYFFMKPLMKGYASAVNKNEVPSVRDIQQLKFAGRGRNCSFWSTNVWSLCSGQGLNTPEASARLFCWHEFVINKAFTIGPLRMEFLSRNPDVVQVHNAFSNVEVEEIRAPSDSAGANTKIENRIGQRLAVITGLQTTGPTASDPVELDSYLPGGHAETHVDSHEGSDSRGDKISTAMIYLNDVSKGGYTVFPASFATAVPSKGSAIFWFNTFSDGSADYSNAHEECPVVWGEKSVAYKRMRFYDQFKARKCLLQPKTRFQVLVNGKVLPVPGIFTHKTIGHKEFDDPASLSTAAEAAAYNTLDIAIRKYAQSPSGNLEAFIQLDLEIYQNTKRLLRPGIPRNDNNGGAQALILGYLQDFNDMGYNEVLSKTNEADSDAVRKLARNPLAVYRAFWRFENYIKTLLRHSAEKLEAELREVRDYIGNKYNESDGPLERDLEDTIAGILNLQFVHDLKSQDIARGIMAGVDTRITLPAIQCIELGIHAISKDYYYQAINWMEAAVSKIASENDTTASLTEAEIQLETVKKVHDKFHGKSAETTLTFYTSPVSGLPNWTDVKTRKEVTYNANKGRTESNFTDLNLAGLCQGKRHQTIQEQSKLFCWYEHQVHPYFRVGPLQVELFSMHPNPEVVMYHDVLSQELLAFLRNDSGRNYTTCATTEGGETDSRACLLASTLVHRTDSVDALRTLKLASRITGLNAMLRGILVHASGPGGHNGAHTDSGGPEEKHGDEDENKGMATVMFYAVQPEMGGMTAFAQAGIQIPAKAGSVLFWLNTLSSGALDTMSYHAGCPVIFGHKRVSTVLVSYVGQTHLKCATDPLRRMEVLVNGASKYGYG